MSVEVFRNCFVCDYKAVTSDLKCPSCGKPLQSEATIRFLGGVLSFLGLVLITIMTLVINGVSNATRVVDRPGHYGESARNAPNDTLIYAILLAVLLMGIATLLAGGTMVVTGRRNMKLLWIMIGLGMALGSFGVFFRHFIS